MPCPGPLLPPDLDWAIARDFGAALLLGGLLGVEREQRNARSGFGIAGLRSFVLLAQLGAVAGFLGQTLALPWLLPATVVAVAAVVIAGYLAAARQRPDDLGVTTELAAIVTVFVGALATTGHRELAAGVGVGTAALLAGKEPLHGFVGRLGQHEVMAGVRFLLATFIVLPLLPDRAIDPWGVLNPYTLWLLVLLVSGLSLVGYVATRWIGPRRGIAVTAAAGGLVSSTAVTLTLVKQSREPNAEPRPLAGGILLAWGVMFLRLLAAVAIVTPALLRPMLAPCVAMAAACGAGALLCFRHAGPPVHDQAAGSGAVPLRNPLSLVAAGKFALLFAAVSLLLKLGQQHLPQSGVYVIAAVAGLTDVDAIALSMAEHARAGGDAVRVAVLAIAIAAVSNTMVKAGLAVGMGKGLGRPIAAGTAIVLVVGTVALFVP
jgi:uncharacterized membrane protein (DUF4010 family)